MGWRGRKGDGCILISRVGSSVGWDVLIGIRDKSAMIAQVSPSRCNRLDYDKLC